MFIVPMHGSHAWIHDSTLAKVQMLLLKACPYCDILVPCFDSMAMHHHAGYREVSTS